MLAVVRLRRGELGGAVGHRHRAVGFLRAAQRQDVASVIWSPTVPLSGEKEPIVGATGTRMFTVTSMIDETALIVFSQKLRIMAH